MWAAIKMEGQICCNPHPLYKLNFFALCLFVSELRVGGHEFSSFMQAYLGRWGGGGAVIGHPDKSHRNIGYVWKALCINA